MREVEETSEESTHTHPPADIRSVAGFNACPTHNNGHRI